jgi:uncharacterized protein YggU (UPF0235/DUF167 family)
MSEAREPWRIVPSGLRIRVRLTPKASRDAVEGLEQTAEGPALKARVRAVPEGGAANAAAARVIADWLGVARGTVTLVGGAKSRIKTLEVEGEGATLAATAGSLLARMSSSRGDA